MAYKRKTKSEWYIEQYTCNGWEEVTCDSSLQHHLENLSLYRKEGYLVRGKTRRIKLSEEINND
jgi:hypothetical protein